MTKAEFYLLARGDIVRNTVSGNTYIVADFRDGRATLILTVVAENPEEWRLLRKTTLSFDGDAVAEP